jgi:2-methylcitrate dehydratase PrpD
MTRSRGAVHDGATEEAMPLTQEIGRFAAGLTFERLPAEAVEIARTGIIDTVATMVAGAHDPAPQLRNRGRDRRCR